ncbi:hypothetical protein CHLNCDRAFT_133272 [Chlorella variabilis]|uniref:Endonuclease/exonuclease/phosphatase domain-containing protein n=1 Tax=Chlorella variabilis TaxID=554065 RepID=E1Z2R7_CHLVA|nr:hypothetical protein CHLNCDRAFT_133272 [Chlorella variabilis]EFN60044.1 hypothetical protein CHLNCDRAFT_133272 [Chlorella variabilis]|eukprot:XP_005852146.1 hypothetical protein CHLNCDRAFT_133272 [Chlorella variabilis]
MELRVITLNAWGLWVVAKRRQERVAALAQFLRRQASVHLIDSCLAACTADVMLLQEVWVAADVELLRQAAAEGGLPHSFHFLCGAIGSGLLLLSRFRIAQVAFQPYTARGDPFAVLNGDYFAGKGVGWAALDTPAGTISVFNTHLSANYGQRWQTGARGLPPHCRLPRDSLAGVRLLQVLELAAFVRSHGRGSAATVLAGDLNAAPDTLELALLKALLPHLRDAWAEAQPLRLGATANALENSFTTAGAGHTPSRIDYVLSTCAAVSAELALADTGLGFSYSDHVGVAATLSLGGGASSGSGASSDEDAEFTLVSGGGGEGGGGGSPQARPLAPRSAALLTLAELMRRRPQPFQHAAASIEQTALGMARGRRRSLRLAAGLWAAGLGCLGTLAAQPWWAERAAAEAQAHHLALLGGMGTALGWAGVVFVGGFVARGMELRALQQAACQLRLTVGAAAVQACELSPSRYLTCLRESAAAPDCD